MRCARSLHPRLLSGFVGGVAVIAMTFLLASAAAAQAANAQQPFSPDDLKKYSGVLTELGPVLPEDPH
jgi:lipocalin